MIDALPDAGGDLNGPRSRRAAATAAEAAIAHTAAFEEFTRDSVSPPVAEEQAALLRIYEQAAIENAFLSGATANGAMPPPPPSAKRKATGVPGSPTAQGNTNKKGRNDFLETAPGLEAQQAIAFPAANGTEQSPAAGASGGERSRRTTKPSVRLNEIEHLPKKRQTRPYTGNYNAVATHSRHAPSPTATGAGGTKPSFLSRNADRPESLEDAGSDIPSLIDMAAACADVLQVEAGIDLLLPAYKGNNIHARLLRTAFSALRLGAFTMRKPSVALMAKKLWLLAGKFGEAAAQEAAATVGQEYLPPHLQPFGATDPTPVGSTAIDPVLERYFENVYVPGAGSTGQTGGSTSAGASGSGSRGPYRTTAMPAIFVPPVVNLADYSEGFIKLAELGRAMLQMRKGTPAKLQQLLKTQLLVGKTIEFKAKTSGRLIHTGEITERGTIKCNCAACKGAVEVTPTDFEIHAGSSDRRPVDSIYLAEYPDYTLRELLNLIMSDAVAAADVHMDYCLACKLGGDLLCCDGCTAAYHLQCASLDAVPTGQWHCAACIAEQSRMMAMYSARAAAAGGSTRGRGRGRGRRGRPPADGGVRGRGRGRGRSSSRGGFNGDAFGLGGFSGGGSGGRVHMMAPSAMRRNANRPTRNLNRNKRLFEAGEGGLQNGEALHYMNRGTIVLSGTAVLNPSGQSGILCKCCNKVLSCSQFESHAGHSQRRQPYECIFTDDGRNLKAIAAALPTPEEDTNVGIDDEDDEGTGVEPGPGAGGCVLCYDPEFQRDFGPKTMMLCDQCEREFHVGCMSAAGMATLEGLPEGDWFCSEGCGKIHGTLRRHVTAGQISVGFGEDGHPRSQLPGSVPAAGGSSATTQQQQQQKQQKGAGALPGLPTAETVAAAAESAAIAAMQAAAAAVAAADIPDETEEANATMDGGGENSGNAAAELAYADAVAEPEIDLAAVAAAAGNAAASGAAAAPAGNNPYLGLPPSLPSTSSFGAALQSAGYTWQVLNGKDGRAGTTHAIKAAAEILQESFDPIIEQTTNTDLLPLMLYAQQYGDWDYRGVYTLLLRYKGKPVVAATSRVFGPQYAELPLIATRSTARRQGHARVLVSLFLNLLSEAGVHQLVLPAAHETVETWKNGFNFVDMPEEEVAMAKQQLRILVFPGTEVLWKVVDNTVPAKGHHVLKEVPPPEDILGVRHVIQDLVTEVAVAAGEEAPKVVPVAAAAPSQPAPAAAVVVEVETAAALQVEKEVEEMPVGDATTAAAPLENGEAHASDMEQAVVAGDAAAVVNGDAPTTTAAADVELMSVDEK
jgi:hypothetical protein